MSDLSYTDFISAIHNYYTDGNPYGDKITWAQVSNDFSEWGVDRTNYYNYLEKFPDIFNIHRSNDGKVLDVSISNNTYFGGTGNVGESLNSNDVSSIVGNRVKMNIPNVAKVSTTGQLDLTGGIGLRADTGVTVSGVLKTIGLGVIGVGVGATLGKIVGDALYNANPDLWATGNLSKLSETDFNKFVTTIKDERHQALTEGALSLWGVDGDTTTMYADENALAYLTWYMSDKGFLKSEDVITPSPEYPFPSNYPSSFNTGKSGNNGYQTRLKSTSAYFQIIENYKSSENSTLCVTFRANNPNRYGGYNYNFCYMCDTKPFVVTHTTYRYAQSGAEPSVTTSQTNAGKVTQNNEDFYVYGVPRTQFVDDLDYTITSDIPFTLISNDDELQNLAYYLIHGNYNSVGIDGVTNNPNSTQFNPTGVGSVATALGALKNQYPELWDKSIKKSVPQEDGTEDEHVYVPIPIPKFNGAFDTQPTTGTPSQSDPSISPDTTPDDELNNASNTIAPPSTPTDDPNTGGGSSPNVVIPSQQASALWAIYNPSLAQLNQLGAWLWSTDFIDQLLKIFNDPMQAIIGLHKVYATPNISGSGNIKVGYLDSGVGSNIVGNQYTYIDCGTVSLREYYGNILDYSPYTTVQLYLPFIGIVPLDVADVTRASISVKYGVDVLTGACLASVSVQRDNAGGVLYQYSGNCACQYPLSSGSYMGMLTGAIGAVGSLAKGNIFGTALSIAGMHTSIEHSGGFSGNAGAMGGKKPYLIVSRPQTAMNDGFPAIQGYPSNVFVTLGNCTGYVQVADCHVENISATDKELEKIKQLLKEGIIL